MRWSPNLATESDPTGAFEIRGVPEGPKHVSASHRDYAPADAQVDVARNRDALLLAQKDVEDWEGKHYAADQDYRFAKAVLDAKRYEFEAAMVQHRHDLHEKEHEYNEHTAKVGIRPQLVDTRSGRLEMDFLVQDGNNSTHVLNAISPAFTSAFPFASFVADAIRIN